MDGRRSKLIVLAVYVTLTSGVLFLSSPATKASRDEKADLLKQLEGYRSWKQVEKNASGITIATIEIGAAAGAG